ncbi:MAG: hypothetical protein WD969_06895 [Paracoccaceae bacterium]
MRRFLGYLFGLLALAALSADLMQGPMQGAPLSFTSTADYWAAAHRSSLIGFNEFVEANLSASLWDWALLPALTWPACALAAVLSLFFFVIGRRRAPARKAMMFPRRRR